MTLQVPSRGFMPRPLPSAWPPKNIFQSTLHLAHASYHKSAARFFEELREMRQELQEVRQELQAVRQVQMSQKRAEESTNPGSILGRGVRVAVCDCAVQTERERETSPLIPWERKKETERERERDRGEATPHSPGNKKKRERGRETAISMGVSPLGCVEEEWAFRDNSGNMNRNPPATQTLSRYSFHRTATQAMIFRAEHACCVVLIPL